MFLALQKQKAQAPEGRHVCLGTLVSPFIQRFLGPLSGVCRSWSFSEQPAGPLCSSQFCASKAPSIVSSCLPFGRQMRNHPRHLRFVSEGAPAIRPALQPIFTRSERGKKSSKKRPVPLKSQRLLSVCLPISRSLSILFLKVDSLLNIDLAPAPPEALSPIVKLNSLQSWAFAS